MGKGVNYYTFRERFKLSRILRSVTAKHGTVRASGEALQKAVALLEGAVEAKPDEWVYWYVLGDLYQPLGEFVKSVKAGEKCYELRPKDPRSAYALATNLRTLTHAKYVGDRRHIEARRRLHDQMGIMRGYQFPFDPDRSQEALEGLGMTLDEAAQGAVGLFEEVLALRIPSEDAATTRESIAVICQEFPHLRESPEPHRREPLQLASEAAPRRDVPRVDMSDEGWAMIFRDLFQMLIEIRQAMDRVKGDSSRFADVNKRAATFAVARRSVPKPHDPLLGTCYDRLGSFAFHFGKWSALVGDVAGFARRHGYEPGKTGELTTGYRHMFSDLTEDELTHLASEWDNDLAAASTAFSIWLERKTAQGGSTDNTWSGSRADNGSQARRADAKQQVATGKELAAKGLLDAAIQKFKEAIEQNPGLAEAHFYLGGALLQKRLDGDAIPHFKEALRLGLEEAEAFAQYSLGSALFFEGQVDDAIVELKEAVRLDPGSSAAHGALGLAFRHKGLLDHAFREYEEAVSLAPENPEWRVNLGSVLRRKGLVEDAIVCYRTALGLSPDYAPAHHFLAIALHHSGQFDEAIREFRESLRLEPDYADSGHFHLLFGVALHEKGLLDEAIGAYEIVMRMQPDNPDIHRLLARALQGERLPRDWHW